MYYVLYKTILPTAALIKDMQKENALILTNSNISTDTIIIDIWRLDTYVFLCKITTSIWTTK